MSIKFTQAISSAKVYACPEFVEAAVHEIKATMGRTHTFRAVAVEGGYILPVQRYPLNRLCIPDPIEYIAA